MISSSSNHRLLLEIGSPARRSSRTAIERWFDETSSSSHPEAAGTSPASSLNPPPSALNCTTPALVRMLLACVYDWTLVDDFSIESA